MLVTESTIPYEERMKPLVSAYVKLRKRARSWKKAQFQDDADDIMLFFQGCKDDFWGLDESTGKRGFLSKDSNVTPPEFQMVYMKVAEGTEVLGPLLYTNNPQVAANPRHWTEVAPSALGIPPQVFQQQTDPATGQPLPPHPLVLAYQQSQQQRQANEELRATVAGCFRDILNYMQVEVDKQTHMRRINDEALIMGMGVGWCEIQERPGSDKKRIGTFYDSVRNLLLDPDASCWDDMTWVGRDRVMPYWEAEEMFGYPAGSLKKYASLETVQQQEMSTAEGSDEDDRKRGDTCDLIQFTEFYTTFGIGTKLRDVPDKYADIELFDNFPKHCYLAICERCPYPLNLPPDLWKQPPDENEIHPVARAAAWPIPFWKDDRWPCVPVAFHPIPDQLWPMSHFKPALGEIQFVTWCLSYMAGKVRTSCGTLIAALAAAKEEIEEQLQKPGDNKIIWLKDSYGASNINGLISYLQQPEFHQDLWNMLHAMMLEIDKRLGTMEALYGMDSGSKDRSATASDIKNNNAKGRISDMGRAVDSALRDMCRNEALAAWYVLEAGDVSDILGPEGTHVWSNTIKTMPIDQIIGEYDFDIVAGSSRRLSKEAKAELMNSAMNVLGPAIQNFAAQGLFDPWNALVLDWCRANDIENPERYLVQPPPPQPDPKQQAEMQKLQAEQQMQQEQHAMAMQKQQADIAAKERESQIKAETERQKLAIEIQKAQLELQIMREKAQLEMEIERMKASQTMQVETVKAEQQIAVESQKAEAQADIAARQADAKLATDKQMADAKVEQTKKVGEAQVATAKAKAKATPKKKEGGA